MYNIISTQGWLSETREDRVASPAEAEPDRWAVDDVLALFCSESLLYTVCSSG